MIRRGPDNQTGSAGRWLMLAVLMLVLIALLFQPRLERLDGRVLFTINGMPVDLVGALEEVWGRALSDCGAVRDRTAEPLLSRAVLETLKSDSPPDSVSARVTGIHGVAEWLLVEARFDALPPVRVVMRVREAGAPPIIEAVWSGSTYPWRTVPFAGRFLRERVPEVPPALLACPLNPPRSPSSRSPTSRARRPRVLKASHRRPSRA